jgi:hypothetical protein
MLFQTLIVGALVLGCSVYATWSLLPAGARRSIALRLLKLQLPEIVVSRLRRHALASGCGCDGCDHAEKPPATSRVQPIRMHRRAAR